MVKKCVQSRGSLLAAAVSLAVTTGVAAQTPSVSQPAGLNLGATSFYDGFTGSPGWTWLSWLRYSSANAIKDNNGKSVPAFSNPKITSYVWANQIAYLSDTSFAGWRPGFTAILPTVALNSSFGPGQSLTNGGTGLGDITVGAFMQADPVLASDGRPLFVQRFSLDAILPTGKYDQRTDINQGAGFASINPYWAATLFPAERWEVSWRLYYLYNFRNNKPASSNPQQSFNGAPLASTQAGQAAWLNFAASYAITPSFSLGINGYYFQQVSDSKANGTTLPNSKERVLGIGPGMMWRIDRDTALWINAYHETMVRGRTSAPLTAQVRLAIKF
ncbi:MULTISPECIES: SphA family protein [Variovorax]|uniref:SphA family protein n=1 Tax=Variovorax TaxID=34072 RepID=UPI0021AC62BB|nr:transporter [Variovorax paradoxus]UVH55603.1 transporter [Variovorax paradoxus]